MDPSGSTALVTGANRGIGLALVRELTIRGADVLAGIRDPAKMPAIDGVRPVRVDLADPGSIEEAAAAAGPVDLLVNNGGLLQAGQLEAEAPGHLYEVLQVNLA